MNQKSLISLVVFGIIAVLVLGGLGGSFYTIDQQKRGLVLTYGKLSDVSEPGFHWKIPFVQEVKEVDITEQTRRYQNLQAYSRDQQVAELQVSVSYSVPTSNVGDLYSNYGTIDNFVTRIIDSHVPQAVENVFGQYNAITAVQDRVKLVADLNQAVKQQIGTDIVRIESVQLEQLSFSKAYDTSIEQRMQAEVAVEKRKQDLEGEKVDAQIKVTRAKAQADSDLAIATAHASATKIQGEADAAAIKAKADALNSNPQLVQLAAVDKWNGALPNQFIPGAAVPFVPLK